MRRLITVILALQFFCSVSIFAFGQGKVGTPSGELGGIVISALDEASKVVQIGQLSVLDAEHDLLDDKPDLPDSLDLTWYRHTLADAWPVPHTIACTDWLPPTLAGLQRPPQA